MDRTLQDIPDPIARNRRERRLAWALLAILLALAAVAARVSTPHPDQDATVRPVVQAP